MSPYFLIRYEVFSFDFLHSEQTHKYSIHEYIEKKIESCYSHVLGLAKIVQTYLKFW